MVKDNGPFIRQFSVVNGDPIREEEFILMKEIMRKMIGRWMQEVLEIKHPVLFRLDLLNENLIIPLYSKIVSTPLCSPQRINSDEIYLGLSYSFKYLWENLKKKFGGKNITNKLNKIWNDLLDKNFDKEKLVYSFLTKEFFVSVVKESFELKNENISMLEQLNSARQSLKWLHVQNLTNLSKKGGLFFDNFVFSLNTNFGTKSRLLGLLGGLDGSEDVLKKYADIRRLVKIGMYLSRILSFLELKTLFKNIYELFKREHANGSMPNYNLVQVITSIQHFDLAHMLLIRQVLTKL
uniref:Uncharacterized protein n=1 Tax=Meloidogyne enterolobii TaxID=390850 RepID=A0A6V7VNU2_MELEN|nr:unnamed protein product [Meloidogyne enterolobii]